MGWSDVLDDMERRIAGAERVLGEGGAPPVPFQLPGDLGPLPASMVERAERIRCDTERVINEVSAALSLVASALCRPQEHDYQAPSYVDARI